MIWVGNKYHMTYKNSVRIFFSFVFFSEKRFNAIVLVAFFPAHAALCTPLLFFFFCSRVTVDVSLAFTVRLIHAAMKFAQEHVKHMVYYLDGNIFRKTAEAIRVHCFSSTSLNMFSVHQCR